MFPKAAFLIVLLYSLSNFLPGQNFKDSLTIALEAHYQESDLPGFAVAIVDQNGVKYQQGFGYADLAGKKPFRVTSVQNLGSVSKTVVGLAVVKAVADGKLDLDTKINDILPFPVINPYAKEDPILVRHLVTHTSGILDTKHYGKSYIYTGNGGEGPDYHPGYLHFIRSHEVIDLKDFLFNILSRKGKWYRKKNFLRAPAGTEQEYSNLNAALAGYIVELATGQSFRDYTREKIFNPLGMTSTSWDPDALPDEAMVKRYFPVGQLVPDYGLITYPDGGLYSSVADLSLLLREMIKAYTDDSDYLPPPFNRMLLPGDDDEDRAFWGMGQTSRNIGHGGSDPGVQTDLQFNADRRVGRVIFTNVNAEDSEELWAQYRRIHDILAVYEGKL